jgi:cobalamin biosynthesis Mg chelatase CobN
MRRSASLAVVVAALAMGAGAAHADGGPSAVYNDYAQDQKLSCNHSRADLEGALHSGTLNQYGDPYTLTGMKLAIRRQLAGGCRSSQSGSSQSRQPGQGSTTAGGTSTTQGGSAEQGSKTKRPEPKGHRPPGPRSGAPTLEGRQASVAGSSGSFIAGRGLILLGLVVALALGGWLTRRALATRD